MLRARTLPALAIILISACADPAGTPDPKLVIEGGLERTIRIGTQEQLRAVVTGASNAEATQWISSDPSIAQVDAQGFLRVATTYTACNWVTPGECQVRITAIKGELRADQILTVVPFEPTLELSSTHLDLEMGDSTRLTARVLLEQTPVPWCSVGYTSQNSDIARIGTGGVVFGMDEGNTVITVHASGPYCPRDAGQVHVTTQPPRYVLAILPGESVHLSSGQTLQLIAQVTNWKTIAYPALAVVWASSNPGIAAVSSDGVLRAGSCDGALSCRATITARSGRLVATKEIILAD